MKRIFTIVTCCLGAAMLLSSCGQSPKKAAEDEAVQTEVARQDSLTAAAKLEAETKQKEIMETIATLPAEPQFDLVTNMGTMRIKLYSDTPKHRENFAKLALSGFYDGILFHRVIPGFMVQTGDPLTKDAQNKEKFGTGGPGYTIPAEIVEGHGHKLGAIAAARLGDKANPMKESSGSQFYIVVDEVGCSHLDGQYSVFGEVITGVETAKKISQVDTDPRDCPLEDVKIEKVLLVE
ncbi:MAG: peptidylprolyl isomerase [Bacteroidales bacterium]|nr:peptidylprolyl isomerase [Bacteroidales bacterium]